MFDPFKDDILLRGQIVKINDSNSVTAIFINSSALLDESELGDKGKEVTLVNVQDVSQLNVGDKIVAKVNIFSENDLQNGDHTIRGINTVKEIYPDSYQPFGVDWKDTFWIVTILLALIVVSIFIKANRERLELGR